MPRLPSTLLVLAFGGAAAALAALAGACSSSTSSGPEAAAGEATGDDAGTPLADSAPAPPAVDAALEGARPAGTGGTGGLTCTRTDTITGRSVCVATIGSVELKVLVPVAGATGKGPLRLGLYLHGDGAAAHKSGSVFKTMMPWADGLGGIAVSALAPNGCAWWQAPTHDCASSQVDADLAGANAAALVTAIDAIMKAYDIRTDGMRYYGASGGSIFLTDEWLPLQGGKYPGVFAIMCGGDASSRAFGWDTTNAALRTANPLWFTYGDQDFLLTDEQASVAAFKGKGFAVTEKVVPNAGHCTFDAHGEAIAIWTANP